MSKFIDLTGQKFNNLLVVKRLENAPKGRPTWLCECECGNQTIVRGSNLKNGAVKSCGCLTHIARNKKHGMKSTRLYSLWNAMKTRCNNPNSKAYKHYGERGISVCKEWNNSFEAFRDWSFENGYTEGLSIDRIDNSKGYCPENCRWVPWAEQCNNRKTNVVIEYKGEVHNLMQWSKILQFDYKLVHCRMKKMGWTFEKAITTPKLYK